MNPLAAGWFDMILVVLSAVMASGWVLQGFNGPVMSRMMPVTRPLNKHENPAPNAWRRDIDTDRQSERRKLIKSSFLST